MLHGLNLPLILSFHFIPLSLFQRPHSPAPFPGIESRSEKNSTSVSALDSQVTWSSWHLGADSTNRIIACKLTTIFKFSESSQSLDIEKMYELKEDLENFATKDSVTS